MPTRYGNRTHIAGLKARRASRCTNRAYCGFKPAARLIRLWRLLREVHLRTLPPESIKPAKYSGRGTPVRQSLPLFLFNPTILFQIAREVCYEYVVSLHLDKSVSILNEVGNVCIHCFNGATYLYAPNGFNGHYSDCQPFTLAQPPVPS